MPVFLLVPREGVAFVRAFTKKIQLRRERNQAESGLASRQMGLVVVSHYLKVPSTSASTVGWVSHFLCSWRELSGTSEHLVLGPQVRQTDDSPT